MAPRTKKTEQPVIREETLTIRPVMDEVADEIAEPQKEKVVKRGRPKKEKLPASDMLPLTVGVVLQQARQAKHMKLPSISKKLKIKETYLDALEKGNYHVFPALAYGAGFLRTYATFLGLKPDELVARFQNETSDIKEEPLDLPRSHDAKILPSPKVVVLSLLALFFLYLIWNFYQIMTTHPFDAIEKPVLREVVEIIPSAEPAPVTADEIVIVAPAEDKTVKAETKPEKVETKRTPAVYGLKTPARVSFVATGKTTIEVRDVEADSVLLKKNLESGDRYNPDSDPEGLALKTTNAGALDVYVDGKKIRTLGKKGQVKTGIQLDAASLLKD